PTSSPRSNRRCVSFHRRPTIRPAVSTPRRRTCAGAPGYAVAVLRCSHSGLCSAPVLAPATPSGRLVGRLLSSAHEVRSRSRVSTCVTITPVVDHPRLAAIVAVLSLGFVVTVHAAPPAPSGPHPRIALDAPTLAALKGKARTAGSAVSEAIATCEK